MQGRERSWLIVRRQNSGGKSSSALHIIARVIMFRMEQVASNEDMRYSTVGGLKEQSLEIPLHLDLYSLVADLLVFLPRRLLAIMIAIFHLATSLTFLQSRFD